MNVECLKQKHSCEQYVLMAATVDLLIIFSIYLLIVYKMSENRGSQFHQATSEIFKLLISFDRHSKT